VQSACLLFAAAGAGVFAAADGLAGLMLRRALIGIGVATALMASLKAIVMWFPKDRIGFANGWVVMLGALGAVTATLPAQTLVDLLGWRGLFALLAAATAFTAVVIFAVVPEPPRSPTAARPTRVKLGDIYRDTRFLRLAPLSTLCIGTAWSLQGLWAAPWLEHVEGLGRDAVIWHLLIMGLALSAGAVLLGWGADRLRRRGLGREAFYAIIAMAFIAAQMMLILRLPVPTIIPWAVIAAVGAATVLSFAILPEYFPKEMSARANAALNILHLTGAFVLQYFTGVIVSWWPATSGHPPPEAYEAAFGFSIVLQLIALLWFLATARMSSVPVFLPAGRLSTHPLAAVSHHRTNLNYTGAGLAFAHHIARARNQLAYWRTIAVASAALCVSLAVVVAANSHATAVAHVLEMRTRGADSAKWPAGEQRAPIVILATYAHGRGGR
jgi:MFS family permease